MDGWGTHSRTSILTPSSCFAPPDGRDCLELGLGCACDVEEAVAFEIMETSPLTSVGALVDDVDFRGGIASSAEPVEARGMSVSGLRWSVRREVRLGSILYSPCRASPMVCTWRLPWVSVSVSAEDTSSNTGFDHTTIVLLKTSAAKGTCDWILD